MIGHKDEKVVTTVHLYERHLRRIDALARRTGHSRAEVMRGIVDSGLAAGRTTGFTPRIGPGLRKQAVERLLRMGDGYGASTGRGLRRLDDELYDGA